ncbi:sphingomyelin phosphodiesterase 4, neutral membrane (neutral sphingomyelinase-3) [Borealophlyctis nickersoniae]|nr:sphingomyelin phosphodiesterase 4, neutral membrane (neutral sphingomyelinase-3) [Borealophlyctis nickersoniae]
MYLLPRDVSSAVAWEERGEDGLRRRTGDGRAEGYSIFSSRDVDVLKRRDVSEFVIGLFVEFWLCQNDPAEIARGAQYVKATDTQMRCIKTLVQYIVSLNLRDVAKPRRMHGDSRKAEEVYLAKLQAYQLVRDKLYTFLKLALDLWPRDDSYYHASILLFERNARVVDIWITFIAPWKAENAENTFTEEWIPFVHSNFAFYTRLLQIFMERAQYFSFHAAVRRSLPGFWTVKNESRRGPTGKRNLPAVERVLDVFYDPSLLEALRIMENALVNLRTHRGGFGAHRAALGSSAVFGGIEGARLNENVRQWLADSGYDVQNNIDRLEGYKVDVRPVFRKELNLKEKEGEAVSEWGRPGSPAESREREKENTTPVADMARLLLTNINGTAGHIRHGIERRESMRPGSSPSSRRSSAANVGGRPEGDTNPPVAETAVSTFPIPPSHAGPIALWLLQCLGISLLVSFRWLFYTCASGVKSIMAEDDDEALERRELQSRNLDTMKYDLRRLEDLGERVRAVWDLEVSDFPDGSEPMHRSREWMKPDDDWLGGRRGRARYLMAEAIRRSTKEDVKIIPSRRAEQMIMTYESATLVWFFKWLAAWLDRQVQK